MEISRLPTKLAEVLATDSLCEIAQRHGGDELIADVAAACQGKPSSEMITRLMSLENDVRNLARANGIKYHAQHGPDDAADFLLEAGEADPQEVAFTLCGFLCLVLNMHFAGEINEMPELRRTAAKTVDASMMVLDMLER